MAKHFETSLYEGKRLDLVERRADSVSTKITVDNEKRFQSMLGFGGAFTEAAAYTLSKMPEKLREEALKAYFDPDKGLNYNLGRVHIHSCDFALGNYTYIEEGDTSLETFDISRDRKWVIPMIKDAEAIRGGKIDLLASPWSPPAWMKTSKTMNNGGKLLPEYRQPWADYYVKFIDEYAKEGLNIFTISVQNEPAAVQTWDSCVYTAEEERDFVRDYLGPTLKGSKHSDVGIVIWDHNRDIVVERATTVLEDEKANGFVWGTGIHWYVSEAFENLSEVHRRFPDKHILFTEGCIEGGVRLGAFDTGERYARNMIGDISNYCEGYLDWNLVLDENGGPNHVGNYCDAPIIADTKAKKLHYNSSYYAIGHFSKYVKPGAIRVGTTVEGADLHHVAFENPDGEIVVIVQNETEQAEHVSFCHKNISYDAIIKPRSISTIIL